MAILSITIPGTMVYSQRMLTVGIAFALLSPVIEHIQCCDALGKPEIDNETYNIVGAIIGTIPIVLKDILQNPTMKLSYTS